MGLRPFVLLIILSVGISQSACSLFRRGNSVLTENKEHQKKFDEGTALFDEAKTAFDEKNYPQAHGKFQQFLTNFPGFPRYDEAELYFSRAALKTGDLENAEKHSKNLVERSNDMRLNTEARIVLAEALALTQKQEEALSLTYDLLPDEKLERQAGLNRKSSAPELRISEKVRLYLIRTQVFFAMGRDRSARRSLLRTRNYLRFGYFEEPQEKIELLAQWSAHSVEELAHTCKKKHPIPTELSEDTLIEYTKHYYSCLAPMKKMVCDSLEGKEDATHQAALEQYKKAVYFPFKLTEAVPPPAVARKAKMKWPEQQSTFENEMKGLIHNTIEFYSKKYEDIDTCNLRNVFDLLKTKREKKHGFRASSIE